MEKERKLQIIRAALKRFIKHGLHKTTLDEVARDLRIGKATLYHYFTSKEDLYYQTLRYEISHYMEDLKSIFLKEDADIRSKFTSYFSLMENIEIQFKLMYDLVLHVVTNAEFRHEKEIFDELITSENEFFKQIFSSQLKRKEYTPDSLAKFITTQGWNLVLNRSFKPANPGQEKDESKEMILSVLLQS